MLKSKEEILWDGVDNSFAKIREGGDPSRLGRHTVLCAESICVLASNGRVLGKGHYPGPGEVSKALGVLLRVMCPGVPPTQKKYIDVYRKVSRYITHRVLDSLRTLPVERLNPFTEFEDARQILISKPAEHTAKLFRSRQDRDFNGLNAKVKASYFVKVESSFKEGKEGLPTLKNRCIFPMDEKMALDHVYLLKAVNHFYSSPVIKPFHIKRLTADQVSLAVFACLSLDQCSNTDFSSFEASIQGPILEEENYLFSSILTLMGCHETAEVYSKSLRLRCFFSGLLSFDHKFRKSGYYETAGGNLSTNLFVNLAQHYVVWSGRRGASALDSLDLWWVEVEQVVAVFEGDDAVVPSSILDPETISGLGFKFSMEEKSDLGSQRLDFLRVAHHSGGKRVINVLRSIRSFQTDTRSPLKISKLKWLLRAAAWSAWLSSPGHPILWVLIKRIEQQTRGASQFRGWRKFFSTNPERLVHGDPPDRFPRVYCDTELRYRLAESVNPQIPLIPIPVQLALEKVIDGWVIGEAIEVGNVFNDYPEFNDMVNSPLSSSLDVDGTEEPNLVWWLRRLGSY